MFQPRLEPSTNWTQKANGLLQRGYWDTFAVHPICCNNARSNNCACCVIPSNTSQQSSLGLVIYLHCLAPFELPTTKGLAHVERRQRSGGRPCARFPRRTNHAANLLQVGCSPLLGFRILIRSKNQRRPGSSLGSSPTWDVSAKGLRKQSKRNVGKKPFWRLD